MSDRRIEREILLEYVNGLFNEASFVFLTSYKGLTVKAFSELRNQLHAVGARCVVLKNSYIKLGLKNAGIELPEDFELTGDTLAVLGADEPCGPAKVVKEFSKDHNQVASKVGVVDGKLVDAAGIKDLADMPPKEVLLGMLLGVMKAPGQRLVRTLTTRRSNIVWTLENYVNKLEEN